jgi:hypothetical protein
VIPQIRWMRSTHSAAIARRSADNSAAICRCSAASASSSRASSNSADDRAAAPIPIPIVARDPRAAQVSGPWVMAHVVQPAPTSQEAARVASVRPALRTRRPATVWPSAPAAPAASAQPGGMAVAAPVVARAKAPVVADRAPVTGP